MSYCRKCVPTLVTCLALIGFPFSVAPCRHVRQLHRFENRRSRWYQTALSNRWSRPGADLFAATLSNR
jgi:hypothetical protein